MATAVELKPRVEPAGPGRWVGLAAGLAAVAAAAGFTAGRWNDTTREPIEAAKSESPPAPEGVVKFAEARWAAAGIKVEPAASAPFTERVWRTGHLALDDTRVAHVMPLAEGIVREVPTRLGQDVKAGDVLAVLDSREVGQAKLDLVKARMATEFARVQQEWTETVSKNGAELVAATAAGTPMAEIEKRFNDRPIGDLRQQLMTAYSRRIQARTYLDATTLTGAAAAIPESSVVRLRADYEAADATFRALGEEVKFQTGQQVRAGAQKLREAQTAEAVCRSALMMLGYTRAEIDAMDPIAEGPKVSLFPVRAPFAGTVIEQHAVRSERVGPTQQVFQVADLSVLWLLADVPQGDLSLARSLAGGRIRFRTAEADPLRDADVFYTGDVVDPATRAVELMAAVPNRDRGLKAGMFVEVELAKPGGSAVQVPAGAVMRQGAQPFVFVHTGGDEFRRADVKLGRADGDAVEVVGGLTPGQSVVVAGGFVLKSELFKDQMAGE
jgi:cobalt-zinc-cadmium efflux system membrane fusion protein